MSKRLILGAAVLVALGAACGAALSQLTNRAGDDGALKDTARMGQMVEWVRQESARFSIQRPAPWQLCYEAGRCWCPSD